MNTDKKQVKAIEFPPGYTYISENEKVHVAQDGRYILTPGAGMKKFFTGPNAQENAAKFCWKKYDGWHEDYLLGPVVEKKEQAQ